MGNGCSITCQDSAILHEKDYIFSSYEELTTPTFTKLPIESFSSVIQDYEENIIPINIPLPTTAPSTLQTPEIHSYNDRSLATPISKSAESKLKTSISHISPSRNILLNSSGDVIHESELLKYKPGMKDNFVTRYCSVTNDSFLVYKSKISCLYGEKALYEVSLKDMTGVFVKLNKGFPRYLLEFLEETCQDFRMSVLPMNKPYSSSMISSTYPNIVDEKHLMPRPYLLQHQAHHTKIPYEPEVKFLPVKPTKYRKIVTKDVRSSKQSWTQREKKMYLAETSLIFGTDDFKEFEKWCYALEHLLNIEVIKY